MSVTEITAKQRVMGLLGGERIEPVPCFSGMGNITVEGLKMHNLRFATLHGDATAMAKAAATTYRLYGFECAVVPFDLCVEAEVLGCEINVYPDSEDILYPTIKEKVVRNEEDMTKIVIPNYLRDEGRIPVVVSAIQQLKNELGNEVAVGSYVLGPFTLAGQIMELDDLLKLSFKKQTLVNQMLEVLTDVAIAVAKIYRNAGADYITVREMGAASDVISPQIFKFLIQPHLKRMFDHIGHPAVLHICGKTNDIVELMRECGPDAISVDQKNDIALTRERLGPDAFIFGNIDPYNVLATGNQEDTKASVIACIKNGVDAVWPGCDIWPTALPENMRAMIKATKENRL
jgi:[methyl-Co(III) methanol-specific corrinoid protein]:coenzyme M methyltransferase